jgi:hypothetical protein
VIFCLEIMGAAHMVNIKSVSTDTLLLDVFQISKFTVSIAFTR